MPYPSKDTLERVKLTLEISTPLILILLVAVLFFNGASIGRFIKAFEEGAQVRLEQLEILGVKANLTRQVDNARDVAASLSDMVARRDKAVELLKCQVDAACTPAQAAEVKALLQRPETPREVVATLERSRQAVAASERVIAKVESALPPSGSDWIVIAGADGGFADAKDEIDRLRRQFPGKSVEALKRGSWYRTVVHFPTADEARSQLEAIGAATGRKPYVRQLSEWCVDLTRESDDARRCTPPAAG